MDNKNEPAFGFTDNRSSNYEDNEVHYGLSKREYFAGLAMQGLMTKDYVKFTFGSYGARWINTEMVAKLAVVAADALLNELSK